jgi:hypothetical protein
MKEALPLYWRDGIQNNCNTCLFRACLFRDNKKE